MTQLGDAKRANKQIAARCDDPSGRMTRLSARPTAASRSQRRARRRHTGRGTDQGTQRTAPRRGTALTIGGAQGNRTPDPPCRLQPAWSPVGRSARRPQAGALFPPFPGWRSLTGSVPRILRRSASPASIRRRRRASGTPWSVPGSWWQEWLPHSTVVGPAPRDIFAFGLVCVLENRGSRIAVARRSRCHHDGKGQAEELCGGITMMWRISRLDMPSMMRWLSSLGKEPTLMTPCLVLMRRWARAPVGR
jgi:hypothetical protein